MIYAKIVIFSLQYGHPSVLQSDNKRLQDFVYILEIRSRFEISFQAKVLIAGQNECYVVPGVLTHRLVCTKEERKKIKKRWKGEKREATYLRKP